MIEISLHERDGGSRARTRSTYEGKVDGGNPGGFEPAVKGGDILPGNRAGLRRRRDRRDHAECAQQRKETHSDIVAAKKRGRGLRKPRPCDLRACEP